MYEGHSMSKWLVKAALQQGVVIELLKEERSTSDNCT
jgi:hypothetical protein